jgi:hypothetical protein
VESGGKIWFSVSGAPQSLTGLLLVAAGVYSVVPTPLPPPSFPPPAVTPVLLPPALGLPPTVNVDAVIIFDPDTFSPPPR